MSAHETIVKYLFLKHCTLEVPLPLHQLMLELDTDIWGYLNPGNIPPLSAFQSPSGISIWTQTNFQAVLQQWLLVFTESFAGTGSLGVVSWKLRGSDDNLQSYNFWAQIFVLAPLEVQDPRGEICGVPQPFRASTLHVKTAATAFWTLPENKNAKL